jgi:dipeptidase E
MSPALELSRRSLLKRSLGAVAFAVWPQGAQAADEPAPRRRIFACGGGMFSATDEDRLLIRYVLSLTSAVEPIVCCLPTAGGDDPETIVDWYETMSQFRCRPRDLRLFGPTSRLENFEQQLLAADVIMVPGGNTLNMLAVWRDQRIDAILRKAWERGIVLAGESAGMICWFGEGITDSRPDRLTSMNCLGWLPGSACPHYHSNPQRRSTFHRLLAEGEIENGVACDDGVGLLYEGTRLSGVVSVSSKAKAYRLRRDGRHVVEEPLTAQVLTKPA